MDHTVQVSLLLIRTPGVLSISPPASLQGYAAKARRPHEGNPLGNCSEADSRNLALQPDPKEYLTWSNAQQFQSPAGFMLGANPSVNNAAAGRRGVFNPNSSRGMSQAPYR